MTRWISRKGKAASSSTRCLLLSAFDLPRLKSNPSCLFSASTVFTFFSPPWRCHHTCRRSVWSVSRSGSGNNTCEFPHSSHDFLLWDETVWDFFFLSHSLFFFFLGRAWNDSAFLFDTIPTREKDCYLESGVCVAQVVLVCHILSLCAITIRYIVQNL